MLLSLLVALSATPLPAVALRSDDPPVRVWLDPDQYVTTGDRMRVHLRAAEDGYVMVLRADAQGRVRVLFPLDPTDDAFVRGGKTVEVKSRGDREAFSVDDASGTGTVLAAWSASPFKTDAYAVNGHWDYRVLAEKRVADDPEAGLLDLVSSLAGDNHFDYDVATYTLGSDRRMAYGSRYAGYGDPLYDPYFASCWGCGPWGWGGYGGYGWRFGFGVGYGCDPWFCDPFYNPWGYYPGGYAFTYTYQQPGWFWQPRSLGPGRFGTRPFTFRPNSPPFVLPRTRVRQRTAGAEPRPRMWNPPPPVIARPRSGGSGSDGSARPASRGEPRREVRPSSPPPRREARPSNPPPQRETRPSSPPPRRDSGGGGHSNGGGGGRRKP